jgi:hypothetical protein
MKKIIPSLLLLITLFSCQADEDKISKNSKTIKLYNEFIVDYYKEMNEHLKDGDTVLARKSRNSIDSLTLKVDSLEKENDRLKAK